jgi:hypothetical protein
MMKKDTIIKCDVKASPTDTYVHTGGDLLAAVKVLLKKPRRMGGQIAVDVIQSQ